MNKEKFLNELRGKLHGLSQGDIDERIAFYNEMINDRMEDGLSEEEAIAEIGTVDSVFEQVMSEIPITALVKEKVKPKRKLKGWEIALLIIGSPVWFPILISVAAVLFSVYIVIWSVIISLFAADVALAAGAVGCIVGIFGYFIHGNPGGAIFSGGGALVCAGLAILFFFVCLWFAKLVVKATGKFLLGIKKSFVGKEEQS